MESEILTKMYEKIIKNFLDIVILMELRRHSMSDYDVISFIHNKFHILLSSGTIYADLYFLEKNGLIESGRAEKRTVYTLTDCGKETVKTLLNSKDKILGMVVNLFIGE